MVSIHLHVDAVGNEHTGSLGELMHPAYDNIRTPLLENGKLVTAKCQAVLKQNTEFSCSII